MTATGLADRIAQAAHQIDLVPWVPRDLTWKDYGDGVAAAIYIETNIGALNPTGNDAGFGGNWQFSVVAGLSAFGSNPNGAFAFSFHGRAIGVRLRRDDTYLVPIMPDFKVDGRMYRGEDVRPRYPDGLFARDHVGDYIIDTDLPDTPDGRPHILEVILPGSRVSGEPTRTMLLYGLLVDRLSSGITQTPRMGAIFNAASVPTSATAISIGPGAPTSPRGITKIIYTNTTAAAISLVVTNAADSGQMWTPETADGKVPPNGSAVLDFGRPVTGLRTNLLHAAGGAGLRHTVIGEW